MPDWSGRRALVTGAAGFIGSHLVEALVEQGAQTRAMVRYNSRGDRGALEWIPSATLDEVEVQFGDVRSPETVEAAVEGVDVVFHLAASIAIPYSYVDPRYFFETNVLGTLNVALAVRKLGAARLIHTSTSEVYGTAQQVPITEDHPISAQSPYAASKVGADSLITSFCRSFDLPATILRPFNTYGPRQSARAVIPTIVSQALAGDIVKLGSLEPRRDFTYVGDTVAGFLAATADEAAGETLQLGVGEDFSVGELVTLVGEALGKELQVEEEDQRVRPPGSEVMRLISSPERMTKLTGWQPKTSLREGIAATIEWVGEHPQLYRTNEYTR